MDRLSRLSRGGRTLLRRLLAAWVKPRRIEPATHKLSLDPHAMTFYVLPSPALSDALLLDSLCRRHGLPPARHVHDLNTRRADTCFALTHRSRRQPSHAPVLDDMIHHLSVHPQSRIQLVPVSIFWGRAPGKRFGLWHTLAADSWQLAGRLRRSLSILVNRQRVEIHFGNPLILRELIDERPADIIARRAARLLRVHFRRTRIRLLGPDLSHRRTLIEGVINSPAVSQAIEEVAVAQGHSRTRISRRAMRYGREIASHMSYPVLRFLDQLLRRLWTRLYDGVNVQGLDRVKALAGDHTLVYVPCHRSHIDYLLLSYVLFQEGLMPPHIAAGRNLDMPIVGPLLRRGGAFFMRRSFKNNRLYSAVFNEYLHRLLLRGHPLEYFIEGGRSRGGHMLPPRPGMLAMTLRSHARSAGSGRRLAFVPVYIGYERILENNSYLQELQGGKKRRESPIALLRVLRRLRQPFGNVAVNVGAPLELDTFLDNHVPRWRQPASLYRPDWTREAVPRLGDELARRINAAAALNPVNMVALVLLATDHCAIERRSLLKQLHLLIDLQRQASAGTLATLPSGTPAEWLEQVAELGFIRLPQSTDAADEARIGADSRQAVLLDWYRHNVLHRFILASLIAFELHRQGWIGKKPTERQARSWNAYCQAYYIDLPTSLDSAWQETLSVLDDQGVIVSSDDGWTLEGCPDSRYAIRLLSRIIPPDDTMDLT
ncbi:glycerol-3-phosphate 1-O-acyltransferase PlsB [Aidingimonas lacisalsi]|uniref:glycerol-3-phosphate 1-O-acyltransferase PlsB n=1 Tax=Aidingimonas lacisalsi TaxID=2604086 RepID=UPI0011D24D94|nr:glycerol-3-phosphate 1-O-acyltransferase PlsB [Aidingimonas lacisalsi]